MKLKQIFWINLLVILAMALAACGGGDDDSSDGGDNGGGDVDLSQSVSYTDTASNVVLTVSIPSDWVSDDDGSLTVANEQEVLDRVGSDSAPQSGEVGAVMGAFPAEIYAGLGLAEDAPILDVANALVGFLAGDGEFQFGDPEATTIGGNDAAVASGTGTFEGVTADATMYLVSVEGGVAFAMAVAPEGELGQYSSTFEAIMGTASVSAAE